MTQLTGAQVYELAKKAGLSPTLAGVATAIAKGESGWRTDAVGDVGIQDSKWGPSVGLWQIRSLKAEYGTGGTRDASRLTDPAFNAASMATVSGLGANFKPWTVYTSGAYKKYLGTDLSGSDTEVSKGDALGAGLGVGLGIGLGPIFGSAGSQVIGDAAGDAAGTVVDTATALAGVFGGWDDKLLKLLATGVAGTLVVAGVVKTVSRD